VACPAHSRDCGSVGILSTGVAALRFLFLETSALAWDTPDLRREKKIAQP